VIGRVSWSSKELGWGCWFLWIDSLLLESHIKLVALIIIGLQLLLILLELVSIHLLFLIINLVSIKLTENTLFWFLLLSVIAGVNVSAICDILWLALQNVELISLWWAGRVIIIIAKFELTILLLGISLWFLAL